MKVPGDAREIRTAVLAASDPCRAVRLWKALSGRKAVGCPPFFPVPEILHAVGMLPVFSGPGEEHRILAPLMDAWARVPNPFPEDLGEVLAGFEKVLVPELNMGQISREVKRVNEGYTTVRTINRIDGQIITPAQIFKEIA